jgi:hypothetical protein
MAAQALLMAASLVPVLLPFVQRAGAKQLEKYKSGDMKTKIRMVRTWGALAGGVAAIPLAHRPTARAVVRELDKVLADPEKQQELTDLALAGADVAVLAASRGRGRVPRRARAPRKAPKALKGPKTPKAKALKNSRPPLRYPEPGDLGGIPRRPTPSEMDPEDAWEYIGRYLERNFYEVKEFSMEGELIGEQEFPFKGLYKGDVIRGETVYIAWPFSPHRLADPDLGTPTFDVQQWEGSRGFAFGGIVPGGVLIPGGDVGYSVKLHLGGGDEDELTDPEWKQWVGILQDFGDSQYLYETAWESGMRGSPEKREFEWGSGEGHYYLEYVKVGYHREPRASATFTFLLTDPEDVIALGEAFLLFVRELR